MVQTRQKNLIIPIVALCVLMVGLDGCGFVVWYRELVIDEPITEKKVQMIHHGETTKKDILNWFGPPVAVARTGAVVNVPHWSTGGYTSADVPADDFFNRYTTTREQTQKLLVYYYEAAQLSWTEYYAWGYNAGFEPIFIPLVADRPLTVMRLWILVDEGNWKVVDHHLEKTVDGRPQEIPKNHDTDAAGVAMP